MVRINNEKRKAALDEMHKCMERKVKRGYSKNEDIILENRIFAAFCGTFDLEPTPCAVYLNEHYGYELTGQEIITTLRSQKLANPYERKDIFRWADEVTDLFKKALEGDRSSYDLLAKKRKEPALKNGKRHNTQERIAAIMLYQKFPEIDGYGDTEKLSYLGNTLAKYFFYDSGDIIANVYGFPVYKSEKKDIDSENKMTYEQAIRKVAQLENSLERTDMMLQELQDEFDEQIEESRIKELTEFFSKLNSEKYGCILDGLLAARKGMDTLKKNQFELPMELNGLFIMVKKLIQFVKDSHIEPMMKVDTLKKVHAAEIEFCNYEGTPFQNRIEEKVVKVVSPGWIYRDKEVQISRPKVKEEI